MLRDAGHITVESFFLSCPLRPQSPPRPQFTQVPATRVALVVSARCLRRGGGVGGGGRVAGRFCRTGGPSR